MGAWRWTRRPAQEVDARDAESLYEILETKVVPVFYDRDAEGLPRAWLQRIRKSMSTLTSAFSSTRMMRQYVEMAYLPRAQAVRERLKDKCAKAKALNEWYRTLYRRWPTLHIGRSTISRADSAWQIAVPIYMGEVSPDSVHVELFADAKGELLPEVILLHQERAIPGSSNGYIYAGVVETSRPADDYTVRAVPHHLDAVLPAELPLIAWQRSLVPVARRSGAILVATLLQGGDEIGTRDMTNASGLRRGWSTRSCVSSVAVACSSASSSAFARGPDQVRRHTDNLHAARSDSCAA